eukprot:TRINITY_DN39516_c0_g1_i1.p2 TRINITY_DN39516_c0_g1~~TRINITY_DN39516_c0_g1_i1.p2  ORF type:complete len:193 (+),score=72.08 TRINITY_DN39516_c0_g1_i1:58-579(+)
MLRGLGGGWRRAAIRVGGTRQPRFCTAAPGASPASQADDKLEAQERIKVLQAQAHNLQQRITELEGKLGAGSDTMRNRMMQVCVALCIGMLVILYHQRKRNRVLSAGLEHVADDVQGKMTGLAAEVAELEKGWKESIALKEKQVQEMHQQSNEQTRSIDRLTTAIRSLGTASR